MPDVSLYPIEISYQLLIAGYPMDDGVTGDSLIPCRVVTCVQILLCLLLDVEGILPTVLDALSTNFQALVHFVEWFLRIIKAMHAASGTFVVHDVEFFIQEGIEYKLSLKHSFLRLHHCILIHVFDYGFIFRNLKVFTHLFMGIDILRRKINLCFFIELFLLIILIKFPLLEFVLVNNLGMFIIRMCIHVLCALTLEESRFSCFTLCQFFFIDLTLFKLVLFIMILLLLK